LKDSNISIGNNYYKNKSRNLIVKYIEEKISIIVFFHLIKQTKKIFENGCRNFWNASGHINHLNIFSCNKLTSKHFKFILLSKTTSLVYALVVNIK